jgi:hypothetical protein
LRRQKFTGEPEGDGAADAVVTGVAATGTGSAAEGSDAARRTPTANAATDAAATRTVRTTAERSAMPTRNQSVRRRAA